MHTAAFPSVSHHIWQIWEWPEAWTSSLPRSTLPNAFNSRVTAKKVGAECLASLWRFLGFTANRPCLTHIHILIRRGRSKFTIFHRKTQISEWKSNGVFLFVTWSNPVMFSVIICSNHILFALRGSTCQELDKSVCRRLELASNLNFDLALLFLLFTSINYSGILVWCLDLCRTNLRPKSKHVLKPAHVSGASAGKEAIPREGKATCRALLLNTEYAMVFYIWPYTLSQLGFWTGSKYCLQHPVFILLLKISLWSI